MKNCNDCGREIDPLEEFPKGRCIDCHGQAPEVTAAIAVMTAEELARMWGAE